MTLFKSEAHRHLFEEKLTFFNASQNKDPRFLSALYIMTSVQGLHGLTDICIDSGFQEIAIPDDYDITNQDRILVALASNLFSGGSEVSPIDLISKLGEDSFNVAMKAIYIRNTGAI